MTNNIRVFLWLGLALALWLNYSQWQMDYGPKPGATTAADRATTAPTDANDAASVPQVNQNGATPASPVPADGVPAAQETPTATAE